MSDSTYASIVQLKPGQYAGEVRDVFGGQITMCGHKHKRRHLAGECGRRMLARHAAKGE